MNLELVNILIAFGGGIVSFLSPCVLPLIPLYLAYINGLSVRELENERKPLEKAFINTTAFVVGFTLVFTIFALLFYVIFDNLGWLRIWVDRVVALILIVFALHIMRIINIPLLNYEARLHTQKLSPSLASSFIMGLIFGAGWTPCIGPILSGILITATTSKNVWGSILLLIVYSLGLGVPFIITGVATKTLLSLLKVVKKHYRVIEIISGSLIIVIALTIAVPTFLPHSDIKVTHSKTNSEIAPNFTAKNLLNGKRLSLKDYRGKLVILNFWATWCDPCREEIPDLIKLNSKYSDRIQVIGVAIQSAKDQVIQNIRQMGVDYPNIIGSIELENAYGGITGVPMSFIVDSNGKLVQRIVGSRTLAEFEKLLSNYIEVSN